MTQDWSDSRREFERMRKRIAQAGARGKRRRPGRGQEGGEPVPVEPRPKPTPLIDGAEAPID